MCGGRHMNRPILCHARENGHHWNCYRAAISGFPRSVCAYERPFCEPPAICARPVLCVGREMWWSGNVVRPLFVTRPICGAPAICSVARFEHLGESEISYEEFSKVAIA